MKVKCDDEGESVHFINNSDIFLSCVVVSRVYKSEDKVTLIPVDIE